MTVEWRKDAYKGEKCFIFGTGASLVWQDPTLIDRILRDEFTMAVNGLYLWSGMTHSPTIYGLIDHVAWPSWHEGIEALDTYRVAGLRSDWVLETSKWHRILQRRDLPIVEGYFSGTEEDFTWCAGRSGVIWSLSMQLIYWLGFQNVYLLGIDGVPPDGSAPMAHCYEVKDFFTGKITSSYSNWNHRTENSVRRAIPVIRQHYEEAGRQVINCNPDSFVKGFPKKALEEVYS